MTTSYFLTAVAISAVITFGLRALPFLAFSGSRKMPASLERLGQALPSAIMAVLIVYCMKDIPSGGISAAVPKLLAAAVVFITYKWKHQTLISILLGTISLRVLSRMIYETEGEMLFLIFLQARVVVQGFLLNLIDRKSVV